MSYDDGERSKYLHPTRGATENTKEEGLNEISNMNSSTAEGESASQVATVKILFNQNKGKT